MEGEKGNEPAYQTQFCSISINNNNKIDKGHRRPERRQMLQQIDDGKLTPIATLHDPLHHVPLHTDDALCHDGNESVRENKLQ